MRDSGRNRRLVASWAIALALLLWSGAGAPGRTPASCPPDQPWCTDLESKRSPEEIGRYIDQLWQWYREGKPGGAFHLADHFEKGDYLPKNLKKAEELYLGLIETGYFYAEPRLGYLYTIGVEAPDDGRDAAFWFLRSAIWLADEKEKRLRILLDQLIMRHRGRPKGLVDAMEWVRSLDQWDGARLYHLSKRYLKGEGVPKDPKIALKLLRRASYNDDPRAMFEMAHKYIAGTEVRRDPENAIFILRIAAGKLNYLPAQLEVAKRYHVGNIVPKCPWKAYYWYRRADRNGKNVEDQLTQIRPHLTDTENRRVVQFLQRRAYTLAWLPERC